MVLFCQILVAFMWGAGLLINFYWAINGRKAIEESGFGGVFMAILLYAAMGAIYWKAGAWDGFFR